ncbi:polysaccharide biosynthesis/export family protein [uncultured Shewanella sp.]|uniref:polysaccharide biosynthesis/export family protein n=1 Tax=uncultured Shewanella sp. TaxID=173975 RepID=UPI002625DECB|nr:polysaccharide biosynthesis/export family protein [uncultured Shewanella sp.]
MNALLRTLTRMLCLFIACTQGVSASLQQDPTTEITPSISDTHATQRYGSWLFEGGFSETAFSAINPHYVITQGDKLLIQIWGAIDYQAEISVDPQGNIFIPKVGPIKVLGITNSHLNQVILNSVKRVYKANVEVYVSLMSSQEVKVFLAGMVVKPGLYPGQSADSVLRFIDQAGGIRQDIGSYRNIQVKRNNQSLAQVDLYQFLQQGQMPSLQFQDGDVIFIGPKQGEVTLEGEIGFHGQYELNRHSSLESILQAVVIDERATHITVIEAEQEASAAHPSTESTRVTANTAANAKAKTAETQSSPSPLFSNTNRAVNAKQYTLAQAANVKVNPGALIKISSQLRAQTISVDVIGEHNSAQETVLPWGASLKDLLDKTQFTALSNQAAVQLYRPSVAKRQYDMLQASLSSLEQSVLTKRSDTKEAAELRAAEAKIILQWIDKARQVTPKGQVLLNDSQDLSQIILQQGDRVVIPAKRHLVIIHGEVMFPTAIAYNPKLDIEAFINKAGGSHRDLDDMNVLIMKPNGSFITVNDDLDDSSLIGPGDEIFVLSKPDEKSFQFAKDITQIIFQIAMSAAVVLAI